MMLVRTITALRGSAAALALCLPLAAAPALAQEQGESSAQEGQQPQAAEPAPAQTAGQSDAEAPDATAAGEAPIEAQAGSGEDAAQGADATASSETSDAAPGTEAQAGAGQESGSAAPSQQMLAPDALVATVDGAEIHGDDVLRFIGALPPQVRQQPPEMVLSLAVQQLVLRELILEQAKTEGMAEDAEVQSLVDQTSESARDDAMVQVWLQRQLDERVTEDAVAALYEELGSNAEQDLPPLDQVRPQIVAHLRQQTIQELSEELQEGADIAFYGPGGQRLDPELGGSEQGETEFESGSPSGEGEEDN